MKRYGYHSRTCHVSKLNDVLNALGEQGWELVSVVETCDLQAGLVLLILKRELP